MYASGEGVAETTTLLAGYRKAAERGLATQLNLGVMYADKGVPEDYVQAYAWFNLSAAQGKSAARAANIRESCDISGTGPVAWQASPQLIVGRTARRAEA